MKLLCFITAILCLAILMSCNADSKHHKGPHAPANNTCGSLFKDLNGSISYFIKSNSYPDKSDCSWTINGTGTGNGTIFLVFDLYMGEDDKISIDGTTLTTLAKKGLTPYISDKEEMTITVSSTENPLAPARSLKIYYYTTSECNHTIKSLSTGVLHSILYDSQKITGLPKNCYFTIIPPSQDTYYLNLWLKDFNFNVGTVTVAGSDKHDGTYNSGNYSNLEFLSKQQMTLQVTINNKTDQPEGFVAYFDEVSAYCSDIGTINEGSTPFFMKTPMDKQQYIAIKQQSLTCRWLVDTAPDKTLTINVTNTSLASPMDQIIILDGPSRYSPVLLDVNSASNPKEPIVFSSGNRLWVSVSTPFFNESFNVQMSVEVTKSGGHMRDKGNVAVKQDSTYLLEVEPGKQVQFLCDTPPTLKDQAVLKFYQDFTLSGEPFYTMSSGTKMESVIVSPTEKIGLVASNFGTSSFSGSFTGIEPGCYKYGQASGDTFSVTGHCNSTCAWIVNPVASSKDLLTFHFHSLSLEENDHVLIQLLDANQTKIANLSYGLSTFPDLWLSAANGAFVQVNRGNCSVNQTNSIAIQSSYQVIPGCETVLTPKPGETVTVTSPGYPNHYPLGSNCTWIMVKPDNISFFHVSFKDIQLAQKEHKLQIFTNMGLNETMIAEYNGTDFNMTGRALPDDIPIFGNIKIIFTTTTKEPLDSRPGFSVNILAVEAGGLFTNSSGKVETPGFPKSVNNSALWAWFVEVDSKETAKQIVQFAFNNMTNQTGIDKVLKVYDGASLRSGVVANYSNSELLSRSNKLLFVYQKTGNGSGPAFSVSYNNFPCNMSVMCENGICMHEDWACNGHNDCGDYSDEKNCEGGGYIPPTPSPTPPPGEVSKGVSSGVLAGSVVAGLFVGAFLGGLGHFAFNHYKNRRSNYDMLSNP